MQTMSTRRQFILSVPAMVFAAATTARHGPLGVHPMRTDHPTPRRGITAAKVLTRQQLGSEHAEAAPVFDMVRQIPQVVDGIRCRCGCAEVEGNYSLLSCYEGNGMAGHCKVCQEEGQLVYRMHKQGKSLDEIRAAIDAEFG